MVVEILQKQTVVEKKCLESIQMDPSFRRFDSLSKRELGGVEEGRNRLLRLFALA